MGSTKSGYLLEISSKCIASLAMYGADDRVSFNMREDVKQWLDNNIKSYYTATAKDELMFHFGIFFESYNDVIAFKIHFPEYVKAYHGNISISDFLKR